MQNVRRDSQGLVVIWWHCH